MNPKSFPEQTAELGPPRNFDPARSQAADEIVSLPVYQDGEQCISLWTMSWRERLSALIFGRVWLQVLSGSTQPPVALRATRTIFIKQSDYDLTGLYSDHTGTDPVEVNWP